MGQIKLVNGQMNFPNMKAPVSKQYAIMKAQTWMYMLNDGQRPTKWLRATKKGTKVNFDYMDSPDQYESGLKELGIYLDEVNKEYGTDLSLKRS